MVDGPVPCRFENRLTNMNNRYMYDVIQVS